MGHYQGCRFLATQNEDDCRCEEYRYMKVLFIGILILIIEIFGGLVSGSLALLADAGHVFVDNGAAIISILVAIVVRKWRGSEKFARSMGGYVNATLLLVIAIWVGFEAITRFYNPREIVSAWMISTAFLGGVLNFWQKMELEQHGEHNHVTHKAMHKHVESDLLQSVGVVAGGIAIYLTGWQAIDPLISLYIAYKMVVWSIEIFQMSGKENGGHSHQHGHHHH
mgnify:CR=1 FL=1